MDSEDTTDYREWRYREDFPADKANLEKAWKLLETYSGVSHDQVEDHVRLVVSRAHHQLPRITQF